MTTHTERQWLPADLVITSWQVIEPFFKEALETKFHNEADFKNWLVKLSELEAVISEDMAWRYIKMTCDTSNEENEKSYLDFVNNIQPHLAPFEDGLNKKLIESGYTESLSKRDSAYFIYFRGIEKAIELYREENIPLYSEIQTLAQKYGTISGAMTIMHEGNELTLQQAGLKLQENDRGIRKDFYEKISNRRNEDAEKLENLFNELIEKRNQIALNSGFENFRDYKFESLGRFDYSVKDCFDFHNAIEKVVVPLQKELLEERKQKLGLSALKPYDLSVDTDNKAPLKPFKNSQELMDKSIACFNKIDPYFGACLQTMKNEHLVDLESRKGKAPGGYNYPLAESGKPFIFMNASGSLRDLETMVHEGGHAIHAFLSHPLELNAFKNCPSEVAELASMSMELISMDAWDLFFENAEDLKRAKISQLEGVISTLPWIATIDAFQHWIYTNLPQTNEERKKAWLQISERFSSGTVDFSGYEINKATAWHKQLHLFEVPFYYIEYGFAQLGAIALWKKYKEDKANGLKGYQNFMKLGYTKSIPEIYEGAGIAFDFSETYVADLFAFLHEELATLKNS